MTSRRGRRDSRRIRPGRRSRLSDRDHGQLGRLIDGKEYSVGGIDASFTFKTRATPTTRSTTPGRRSPTWRTPARSRAWPRSTASCTSPVAGIRWNADRRDRGLRPEHEHLEHRGAEPEPDSSAGRRSLDNKIYFVGGCADGRLHHVHQGRGLRHLRQQLVECRELPDRDSWEACGGINGKVYCAGGRSTARPRSPHAYVYDPASDSWSPIADMPIDLWGSVSGAANGMLVVSSGVTNGFNVITNQGFATTRPAIAGRRSERAVPALPGGRRRAASTRSAAPRRVQPDGGFREAVRARSVRHLPTCHGSRRARPSSTSRSAPPSTSPSR